jgi:Cdc6-like AAA superfamily ATPase
MNAKLFA